MELQVSADGCEKMEKLVGCQTSLANMYWGKYSLNEHQVRLQEAGVPSTETDLLNGERWV